MAHLKTVVPRRGKITEIHNEASCADNLPIQWFLWHKFYLWLSRNINSKMFHKKEKQKNSFIILIVNTSYSLVGSCFSLLSVNKSSVLRSRKENRKNWCAFTCAVFYVLETCPFILCRQKWKGELFIASWRDKESFFEQQKRKYAGAAYNQFHEPTTAQRQPFTKKQNCKNK